MFITAKRSNRLGNKQEYNKIWFTISKHRKQTFEVIRLKANKYYNTDQTLWTMHSTPQEQQSECGINSRVTKSLHVRVRIIFIKICPWHDGR